MKGRSRVCVCVVGREVERVSAAGAAGSRAGGRQKEVH